MSKSSVFKRINVTDFDQVPSGFVSIMKIRQIFGDLEAKRVWTVASRNEIQSLTVCSADGRTIKNGLFVNPTHMKQLWSKRAKEMRLRIIAVREGRQISAEMIRQASSTRVQKEKDLEVSSPCLCWGVAPVSLVRVDDVRLKGESADHLNNFVDGLRVDAAATALATESAVEIKSATPGGVDTSRADRLIVAIERQNLLQEQVLKALERNFLAVEEIMKGRA